MSKAFFKFSTGILKRLGEELNPGPDQSILELIKNSYDADAKNCAVRIDEPGVGGRIEIIDDGKGMDSEGIAESWLVLGRSPKSKSLRTALGRVPAGSKGLGRLAALRMGDKVLLTTRPESDPGYQYEVAIDWSEYDKAGLVEDVPLTIGRRRISGKSECGTRILIEGLRSPVTRQDLSKLSRAMILLSDPFRVDPSSFMPVLMAPEFQDFERLVKNLYFEHADFQLVAELDEKGFSRAKVYDWKGSVLFEGEHDDIAFQRKKVPYGCPKAEFRLWVFLLNKSSFQEKSVSIVEVRKWLEVFGGVHLYENELRVQPYGNAGNDWLDMNLMRARSPEERPSTNTSIGKIRISDTENLFVQKTDRSGFIENDTFQELRSFARDSLDWMAKRRLEAAELRRASERIEAPSKSKSAKATVDKVISKVPPKHRDALRTAFNSYEKQRQRDSELQQREIQLYRTLSTAGITAATFAHESSGNPLKVITHSINAIDRRVKKTLTEAQYSEFIEMPVQSIRGSLESLSVLGTVTLNLLDNSKRRSGRLDVHVAIKNTISIFESFFENRGVEVTLDLAPGRPYLIGTYALFESILTNLVNNSITAFEKSSAKDRIIRISTRIASGSLELVVSDSGPGIEGINRRYIWLPGQTTKPYGTGLGLTIVRDSVKDLGGTIDVLEHGELGGAEFSISLPIIGH